MSIQGEEKLNEANTSLPLATFVLPSALPFFGEKKASEWNGTIKMGK